jgi:nucleotide-binding universal stress UspA family protein
MTNLVVVGYDGSPASRRAVDFAIDEAALKGGSVQVAYVLEWSPYTFLTPEELDERHKRRNEELARAKSAVVDPLLGEVGGGKVSVTAEIRYGHVAETLCKIAEEGGATQLVVGRTGGGSIAKRVFGSVANSLAQMAPVPCTLVP